MTDLTRRSLLESAGGCLALACLPLSAAAGGQPLREFRLTAKPGGTALIGASHPETAVWAYNGSVPGPEIRARQGERLRVTVENLLPEETTVHWHGIRLPNAMDGVPHLTQKPIAPGESFVYEFDLPDAGTYWYHPHLNSGEQLARGLSGPLIVEEQAPIRVDRDVTWVLSDWRLAPDAQISGEFRNRHDMAHAGRLGNTVTINGRVPETFGVRRGERIRLRLINAANARLFRLAFANHDPLIIAYDGHAVDPHAPPAGGLVLGPAMRIDVVLDMLAEPGSRHLVADTFYKGREYRLVDLVYGAEPLRERPPADAVALPRARLPEPELEGARRYELTFNGGAMGGMMMRGRDGADAMAGMMEMMRAGKIWFINGVAGIGHVMEPMLTLERGQSCVLAMVNETAWWHPMHLHGHAFRVISRDGVSTRHREWQDTVLVAPRERVEIAFQADNPGDWMFHCHVLEHLESGMMGVIRVA